ncbi:hypothetical protein QAD02_002709 [Eretmocerus hayati]|uniref:Uncharacterized protein n=1 Tax=Eretmocerus hayati TaxID=131215 RepID=A0ACC2NJT1_9HYME|nr:hypothetical protein QAD02_002709 [Eretmocerus hayati]
MYINASAVEIRKAVENYGNKRMGCDEIGGSIDHGMEYTAQAKEEKLAREKQREKLQLEIAARERAEKKQQEYEERLRNMSEEMERRQAELIEAQEMIRRLEEQLKQLQVAKEHLEDRQKVSPPECNPPGDEE